MHKNLHIRISQLNREPIKSTQIQSKLQQIATRFKFVPGDKTTNNGVVE